MNYPLGLILKVNRLQFHYYIFFFPIIDLFVSNKPYSAGYISFTFNGINE